MKILICSDIHGDLDSCKKALEAFKKEGADKLLLLGDILYHGPRNDLPPTYAPKGVIPLLNEHKNDIIAVRGNCDAEVDQMVLDFPIMQDFAVLELDGLSVLATHGHKFNVSCPPPLKKGEIMLHGHTHIVKIEEFGDENFCINPGSVSIPKEATPRSYIVYSERTFTAKDFDGNVIFEKKF
ncbi:MAG: phosphodiesterase [Clostridia bacterium]|nr:phosphodiesterase [Clostridia bacterium]